MTLLGLIYMAETADTGGSTCPPKLTCLDGGPLLRVIAGGDMLAAAACIRRTRPARTTGGCSVCLSVCVLVALPPIDSRISFSCPKIIQKCKQSIKMDIYF